MAWGRSVLGGLFMGLALGGCGGDPAGGGADPPPLAAEIVQLRRDEVLQRVEVALENTGHDEVVVEQIHLRVPGFGPVAAVPKDSPVPAGQLVNLPTPYGEVRCAGDGSARVGRPVVTVRLHTAADPRPQRVVLRPRDREGVLARIAGAECTARRLAREVEVGFGPDWRTEQVAGGAVAHGTLEARLRIDQPRDLTQVAGTVIYSLRPDADPAPGGPLAALTPERPQASVPVTVSVSRCDGHARGETKKPYAFLVWLSPPGGEEVAVSPVVDEAARAALQRVCPL